MITVKELLSRAVQRLSFCTDTPHLDAELLLAHLLRCTRTQLHIWPETLVNSTTIKAFEKLLVAREGGMPVAYLLGFQEFWSLTLEVTPDTLIPRPETELLVEAVLEKLPAAEKCRVADLGTGSGAIALALASERIHWEVWAIDRMPAALAVARRNANRLAIKNIIFCQSDWCAALPKQYFHCIISNPPYIAMQELHLQQAELHYEPLTALTSDDSGLKDLTEIILQAGQHLMAHGWLCVEHGCAQGKPVRELMRRAGYQKVMTHFDYAKLERVTIGQCS